MPKQDWNINTAPGYAGDVYGLAFTNSQRFTFMAEAAMNKYGVAVQPGASYNTCKVGHASGEVLGIVIRENKLESAVRPGDGTVLIPKGQPLAVMLEGPIQVQLATPISSPEIGVNATGEFGGVAADFTKAVNVKALKWPAAAGEIVPVMVQMTLPAAKAAAAGA